MKTIKGRVILATEDGELAVIETEVEIYGINKVVRSFTDFHTPLKEEDKLLLTIDPEQNNMLFAIEKQGD